MMRKIGRVSLEVLNVAFWSLVAVELIVAQLALASIVFERSPTVGVAVMYVAWGISILAAVAGEKMICARIRKALP